MVAVSLCRAALICIASLGPAQAAHAGFITYNFEGPITNAGTSTPPPAGLAPELVSLLNSSEVFGQRMSGSITVSDAATDLNPDPTFGAYVGAGAISHFSVAFLDRTFTLDLSRPSTSARAFVSNEDTPLFPSTPPNNTLAFNFDLGRDLFPEAPSLFGFASFQYFPTSLDIINSDRIPSDLTGLPGSFLLSTFFQDGFTTAGVLSNRITLTRAPSAVAEPTTSAVFGVGLLALLLAIRGARRAVR
jgi:hypothetical protein